VRTAGIYRAAHDKDLEIHYDELRHGFSREDVEIPPVKIFNDDIVSVEIDPATGDWEGILTFETNLSVLATVTYDPISNCQDDCVCDESCSFTHLYTEPGPVSTNHTVPISGNEANPRICYRIEADDGAGSDPTYVIGTFDLETGNDEIYDIVHTLKPLCNVKVEWKTKYPSKSNRLHYRKLDGQWYVVDASQGDCTADRHYSALFPFRESSEFYITTRIDGTNYTSDVIVRTGSCRKYDPPPPPQWSENADVVIRPFVEAQPNPFNPTTLIRFGVPACQTLSYGCTTPPVD